MADGTGVRAGQPGPPAQTVAALFVAFVAVWSVYFAIAESQASIHNDMAEAYAWGREFQLGYNQHPPFWAWICGAWFMVFPRAGWAFAILTSLNAAIGLLGSWKLIGRFARGDKQIAATALLLLTPFYTFLSYKYNANSIFLSIWPWTTYFFLRAIDEDGIVDGILFGVGMGLALLSKYYALILGTTCFLAALQHPARARYFRSASPYVSIAVAAALCAPHIGWLLTSGAPPVRYLSRISGRGYGFAAFSAATTFFGALAQNAVVFGLVAFTAALAPRSDAIPVPARDPRFRLLATLALAPLMLTALAGVILRTKVSTNMLIGTFSLMPLLAIEIAGSRGLERLRWLSVAPRGSRQPGGAGRLARCRARQGVVPAQSRRHGAAQGARRSRNEVLAGDDAQSRSLMSAAVSATTMRSPSTARSVRTSLSGSTISPTNG